MLFSLDLGNKQTKLKSSKLEVVLPSRYVIADKYGDSSILGFAIKQDTNKQYKSNKSETVFTWGKDLKEGSLESGVIDTMGFGADRYRSEKFALLVDFALAELAKDYAAAKKGFLEVDIQTGLPTEDYYNEEANQALKSAIMGDHSVYIDDTPVNIRVKSVEVTPQPLGTVLNEIVDHKGTTLDNPLQTANIGVVDIGGGTFLADALRNLSLDKARKKQLNKGAYLLYLNVMQALADQKMYPNEHEIEKILLEGGKDEKYIYSPDGEQKFNVTTVVMKERQAFTMEIIGEIMNAYKGFGRMQLIFITGGGANLLIREIVEKELGIVYFVENSQVANVRGFYKKGLALAKQTKGE